MCAIVGMLKTKPGPDIETGLLAKMRDTMVHRGPDGDGIWTSADGRIGLGHRRLAIVDLSSNANQPMHSGDQDLTIVFNGEIYNHQTLRHQLEQQGHRFQTDHSDTETLIYGFRQWGLEGLLQRLDGMFAFAIWDNKTGTLSLARDRVGIKPLYFANERGRFFFASEIKAFLADPAMTRDLEPRALHHFLSFMVAPAPLTMFKNIFKLPAAHLLTIDKNGAMTTKRYWDAVPGQGINSEETKGMNDREKENFYTSGILGRLETAIDKRMMSDVPFGVFLSGGIDSSANVALMARLMDRPVDTFTVGFKDYRHLNELDEAQRVATDFSTNHHQILIDENDMTGYLDDLIHHQDEPIADWVCIPLYFVSKLAKQSGTTVVQVGEGSDEQFCGYDSYMTYLNLYQKFWNAYKGSVPMALQKWIGHVATAVANRTTKADKFAEVLIRAGHDHELFWTGANAFWDVHKNRTLAPLPRVDDFSGLEQAGFDLSGINSSSSGDVINGYLSQLDRDSGQNDDLTRMIYNEFKLRLPELLLMRVDKIGMSASIEARVPFLDHKLVEFTFDIPGQWKTRNGTSKYLLKKALAGILPDDILYRKKMGFAAPMAEWLRGPFGERARSTVLGSRLMDRARFNRTHIENLFHQHRKGDANHALHLWTLFNLTSWYDHWIEQSR